MSVQTVAGDRAYDVTHRSNRPRSWRFEIGLLVATLVAVLFAVAADAVPRFPFDVEVTRAVQSVQAPWVQTFLHAVGWIGFPPQSNVIFGALAILLFLVGFRLEAVMFAFAAAGSAGLWFGIEPLIDRPRPTPDLVNVARQLPTGSFPSGHALNLTAIFGFLIFLALILVGDVRWRTVPVVLLAIPIATIGVARLYEGGHWPSDVLGGYLIGAIWLGLSIRIYQRLRDHFGGSHQAPRAGRAPAEAHAHESDVRQPA